MFDKEHILTLLSYKAVALSLCDVTRNGKGVAFLDRLKKCPSAERIVRSKQDIDDHSRIHASMRRKDSFKSGKDIPRNELKGRITPIRVYPNSKKLVRLPTFGDRWTLDAEELLHLRTREHLTGYLRQNSAKIDRTSNRIR